MPSGSYKGKADVLCPFYRTDDSKRHRIVCEGIVDKSTLAITFCSKRDYADQLDIFCCEYYRNCEIYRMIMASKYEEDD